MKKQLSHSIALFPIAAILALVSSPLLAQRSATTEEARTKERIEASVRRFWNAFGKTDVPALKTALDWPCSFLETTPANIGQSFVFRTPEELEGELSGQANPQETINFSGAVLTGLKVEMVNASLANVTYTCFIPQKQFKNGLRHEQTLKIVTILRKKESEWKVSFTGIPM